MALQLRRVERLENGEFKQIQFSELKAGDQYKLYDDCEDPIEDGSKVYTALTDAQPCEPEGNYSVEIEKDPYHLDLSDASEALPDRQGASLSALNLVSVTTTI